MVATKPVTTADELFRMPDDGQRHELVRGELRTMTPAGFDHGDVGVRLTLSIGNHVKTAAQLGKVLNADTGFRLAASPDTVRAPDVAFVSRERIGTGRCPGYWPGAPDLAAEVVSPSDSFRMVQEKVLEWLDAGARMVLVLEPEARTATVYRSRERVRILGPDDAIDGEDVLPGWRCPVRDLFPG